MAHVKAYVQKRHDILMDDTLRGYLEVGQASHPGRRVLTWQSRWEFTVPL